MIFSGHSPERVHTESREDGTAARLDGSATWSACDGNVLDRKISFPEPLR
jgi:hypothetical protein